MNGWSEFGFAMVFFLLSHVIPVRPPVRPWLVHRFGLRAYYVGYSLVSVGLMIWLFIAVGRAPYVEVIPPLDLFRWGPVVVMPLVCLLTVLGLSIANPFSFGGMGKGPFDPDKPGILAVTRHPLLVAIILWAFAHMLANGDLAHVVLFGMFVIFPVLSMGLIDRRKQRLSGKEWASMAQNTSRFSLKGVLNFRPGILQSVVAVVLFSVLLALHAPVIGVSPLP